MTSRCVVGLRYAYEVYGVRVTSEIPLGLPEVACEQSDDASLASVDLVDASDEDFTAFSAAHAPGDDFACEDIPDRGTYLRWPRFYEFIVHPHGVRVACRPLHGCDSSVLRNFLLGQVIAVALVRQGLEPLHASVAAIDGAAVGFVGDCSYGKSTLLASLVDVGFRAVTDDMLIVTRIDNEWHTSSGSGRIKLMPDAAERFVPDSDGTQLTPLTAKRAFVLDESKLQRSRVPLRVIYVLPTPEERAELRSIEIRDASQAETVCELIRNTFSPYLIDRSRLVRQFEHAADVASRTRTFRLRYPAGLDHLPDVRQAIVAHARHIIGTATGRAHE